MSHLVGEWNSTLHDQIYSNKGGWMNQCSLSKTDITFVIHTMEEVYTDNTIVENRIRYRERDHSLKR